MTNNSTAHIAQSWYGSFTWPHVMSIWVIDSVFFDVFLLDIGFSQRGASNVEYSDSALMDMLCELIRLKHLILFKIKRYICLLINFMFTNFLKFFIIVSFCIPTSVPLPPLIPVLPLVLLYFKRITHFHKS